MTGAKRFLVVTEDAELRHAVLGCLADLAEPVADSRPRAALARLHDEPIDLLVVDVDTADGLGWALLEVARCLDEPPRVVAVLGSLAPHVVARARKAGAHAVLHRRLMVGPALRAAARLRTPPLPVLDLVVPELSVSEIV